MNTQIAADFIKTVFGPTTEMPVHFCSLGNERDGRHSPRMLNTRNPDEVTSFMKKFDIPERGLFFCVGTLKQGAEKRNKQNIAEISMLHADIDLKDVTESVDEIVKKLKLLKYSPSAIVASGNGVHAYWLLSEGIVNPLETGESERVEAALRQLADLVGGDLQVCEIARLMRLPGSHNSKKGAWKPVEIMDSTGKRYHLDDLEDWLAEASPVILRKSRAPALTAGQADDDCPYMRLAREGGFKPPIDIKARLDAMMFMGGGKNSVHETQIDVASSMVAKGHDDEEIVELLMAASRAAAGDYGMRWNWRKEEREIRKDIAGWRVKLAKKGELPKPKPKPAPTLAIVPAEATKPTPSTVPAAGAELINLAEARTAAVLKPKPQTAATADVTTIVADGVIETIRATGQDIMLSEGEVWMYREGIWYAMTGAERQWIMTMIQDGFGKLNVAPKANSINGAFKRLTEHPGLFQRQVKWSDGSVIVCQNGVLAVATGQFAPHSPTHYARRKIGAAYVAGAECPEFVRLLTEMFGDRDKEEQQKHVDLIQEFFGAALAPKLLSREQRKAAILVGASRSGKTEVSYSLRALMGSPIASPSVAEISGSFGLASFYDAIAWIRDDAVNEGDELDAQRFKMIITGEPIDINRKGLPAVLGVSLAMPVLLTANSLPRTRDKSDAIYNRSLIVDMNRVFSDEEAHTMKKRLGVPPGAEAATPHIFSTEGSGMLNWALAGLKRLMDRGRYDPPVSVTKATQTFKDDNNPVGEWVRACVEPAPDDGQFFYCVSRDDLMRSYHGWQREQDGEAAKALGARGMFPRLRSAAPYADASTDAYVNDAGKRHVVGIKLTDAGLALWEAHGEGQQLKGGSPGSSERASDVNKVRTHESRIRGQVEQKATAQPKVTSPEPHF